MRIVIHCDDDDLGGATAIAKHIEEGPIGALWVGEVELIHWSGETGSSGYVESLDMRDVGCGGENVSASRLACDFTS